MRVKTQKNCKKKFGFKKKNALCKWKPGLHKGLESVQATKSPTQQGALQLRQLLTLPCLSVALCLSLKVFSRICRRGPSRERKD